VLLLMVVGMVPKLAEPKRPFSALMIGRVERGSGLESEQMRVLKLVGRGW